MMGAYYLTHIFNTSVCDDPSIRFNFVEVVGKVVGRRAFSPHHDEMERELMS
jgi:hypothetical protein